MSSNDIFKENSKSARSSIKREFIKHVNYECVLCDNQGFHNNQELILELDHINGIRNDNRLQNLRLVCPNCHSQLKTSNRRKFKPKFFGHKKINEHDVLILVKKSSSIREILLELNASDSGANYTLVKNILEKNNISLDKKLSCSRKYRKGDNAWRYNPRPSTEKINWPVDEELKSMVFQLPLLHLAKQLGVSDVAIKRRCIKRKINLPPQGYWSRIKYGCSHDEAMVGKGLQVKQSRKKLSNREIKSIKSLIDEGGISLRKISRLFNVSHATISDIKNKKTHKNI